MQHPVGITIEPVAGPEGDAAKADLTACLAPTFFGAFYGRCRQCKHQLFHGVDFQAVADGTVDYYPRPSVPHSDLGQHIDKQCDAVRAFAIDNQDAAFPRCLQLSTKNRVVLEFLHSLDRRREMRFGTGFAKGQMDEGQLVGVVIDQIGGHQEVSQISESLFQLGNVSVLQQAGFLPAQGDQELGGFFQFLGSANSREEVIAADNRSMIGQENGRAFTVQRADQITRTRISGFDERHHLHCADAHHYIGRQRWDAVFGVRFLKAGNRGGTGGMQMHDRACLWPRFIERAVQEDLFAGAVACDVIANDIQLGDPVRVDAAKCGISGRHQDAIGQSGRDIACRANAEAALEE